MAEDSVASIIALHRPKRARSGASRARRARASKPRKRQRARPAASPDPESVSSELLIPADFPAPDCTVAESPDTPPPTVALRAIAPSRSPVAAILLAVAAFALAAVGIITNGWFARSLGSSDIAGWLFMAIGVAADLAALVLPSCAAALWHARQPVTCLAGWAVWAMTLVFAVTAGIGFASVNITDVAAARAARVTPAVAAAQSALSDAMWARDRECGHGVGRFCREREAAVAERRQILDTAIVSVGQTADPQTDAAIKLVAWLSHGVLRPSGDDFAMLRLVLLALLPQIGGILLMVSRSAMRPGASG
ncbi:MAG: hypothetical protein HY852_00865 [Bradyrhizobium sp.]|uniref:hypothetical protein n=1 Tax=Bradyrhizobium sp. TaxID=376 RepID=UPI0025BC55BE|nr:hypothetical protein [Bradyrhizobium sp.]MBI5260351.1 hypothetical protein [Bradyrhizobium sp.]